LLLSNPFPSREFTYFFQSAEIHSSGLTFVETARYGNDSNTRRQYEISATLLLQVHATSKRVPIAPCRAVSEPAAALTMATQRY
jgi:hypothetical protein